MAEAVLRAILRADGADFVSSPIPSARLAFGGIAGDRHAGLTRRSCARTPWHARGTAIANTRQISIVSVEDCRVIADLLDVPDVDPGLLGANLVTEGIGALSALPPATRLKFPSGATLFVTEENVPCGQPARMLARVLGLPRLRAAFVRAATGRRGLLAMVEREGEIRVGDTIAIIAVTSRRRSVSRA